jgi:hypothetical protein
LFPRGCSRATERIRFPFLKGPESMVSTVLPKKTKSKRISKDDSQSEPLDISRDELDSLMEVWSALTAIVQAGKSNYYKANPGEFPHLLSALGFVERELGDLINNISLRSVAH